MAGTKEHVEGAVKETAGKVTGDKSLERKGKMKRVEGNVREKIDNVGDAAKRAFDGHNSNKNGGQS